MTTLAPVIDLIGDVGSFSIFNYGGDVWVAYIRESGELELHQSGAGTTEFIDIDVPFPKAQVSVATLGSTLLITWTQRTTQELYFSKYDMSSRKYTLLPMLLWAGSSPALAVADTTKLVLLYRDSTGQNAYRLSTDGGAIWLAPVVVDNVTPVSQVGADVYTTASTHVYWVETADP
jgi:hypothetical protein